MITESRLRVIRDELRVSRERLAFLTGGRICTTTIRNMECGRNRVTIGKAKLVLAAINGLLAEAQKPAITMDDLMIDLY